ncbi:MAG: hypothetical protein AAB422_00125 [Planctomycetota bacterium]
MIPEHLKYSHTHVWFYKDNKSITAGLTKVIIDKLDKLLFLDLPKVGEEILSNISFGEIESHGMLLDIMAPLAGEVIAVNERLYENLDTLSKDPYKQGWLIKFTTSEAHIIDRLFSAQEYVAHITKGPSVTPKAHFVNPLPHKKRPVKIVKKKTRK